MGRSSNRRKKQHAKDKAKAKDKARRERQSERQAKESQRLERESGRQGKKDSSRRVTSLSDSSSDERKRQPAPPKKQPKSKGSPKRKNLLEVRGLRTQFHTEHGTATAVDGVSFDVYEGEVLGIVGESGSGKSVCSLSILRLIPNPPGDIVAGTIQYKGRDLLALSWDEMYKVRGREIAMIFQEPMTALNPVYTVGFQITEMLIHHEGMSKSEAFERGVKLLDEVGIPAPRKRMIEYPHQFSGGMRQRAMIAMALACNPSLLIADEPTTALDVTIQAQILELMLKVKDRRKEAGIILITHDLAVVAETCDRVIVLYGGKIQETAPVGRLFKNPHHPYTQGLLASLPRPDLPGQQVLETIPGMVPNIHSFPKGCRFSNRCPFAEDRCITDEPALVEVGDDHQVRCHLVTDGKLPDWGTGTLLDAEKLPV